VNGLLDHKEREEMNRTTTAQQERKAPSQPEPQEGQPPEGASGCLLRVYWMLLGNALVFLCAYLIVQAGGALTLVDAVYWLAVAGLLGARYVDVRYMEGRTAEGQPATMRDWQRYRLGVLGASVVLFAAAHAVGCLAR
jgi:hypothetical protein